LKTKDALSRDFKGGSLRSHLFSTTPLASFLGSPPLLFQEGKFAARHIFLEITRTGSKAGGWQTVAAYAAQFDYCPRLIALPSSRPSKA